MTEKVEKFIEYLQKFYDRGFLREVFRTEKVLVCNVFNQFYMVFDLEYLAKHYKEDNAYIPGFVVNSIGLKQLIRDDNAVTMYRHMVATEGINSDMLRHISESMFQQWIKREDYLKQKPVPEHMDMAFEAELLEKGPAVMRARLSVEEKAERKAERKAKLCKKRSLSDRK